MTMRRKGRVSNKISKRPRGVRPLPIGVPNKSTRTGQLLRTDLPSGIKRSMKRWMNEKARDIRGLSGGLGVRPTDRGISRRNSDVKNSKTPSNRSVKGKKK